jgi:RNA polymerase sigma-70 factor (ECF subfamily)
MKCVETAWGAHRAELMRFLRHKLGEEGQAEDLLQDVFLRATQHLETFCAVENRRAWLFQVARNAVVDFYRRHRPADPLPDDLAADAPEDDPLAPLCTCLVNQLERLPVPDREALTLSELDGVPQKDVARTQGLSVSGAKSRVQRARVKLRDLIVDACHVEFDERGRVVGHSPPASRC